ncbi:MAG TPA: urea ABC transporter substrate-binding protein [Thiothrix sp.]|nr:urea ABC transporter substrate-binding protein [Thiothrix sp.]
MSIKSLLKSSLIAASAVMTLGLASIGFAAEEKKEEAKDETIKVGVLHSLSGTMAISETTLKDTVLMMIEEQNKKGGVLGKKLEAVVKDPASDWPLFAEKARELLEKDKVAATFGCWTSVSRKSVLPVYEELNGLLFYPVQYEGEESSKNVFYTGAAPNQQAIPAVDYLMNDLEVKRWVLAGTDYVYPRTTNKILEAYLKAKGVDEKDIMINYTPFGHSDWQSIVSDIKKFGSEGKKTAVVSTINGDANVPFYKELGNQGLSAEDIPVVAFSVGEEELSGIDTKPLVGHLAAWNYFQSVENDANTDFIKNWKTFIKDEKRVTNDPMEATVIGFNLWVKAVEKAGSTDPDAVEKAIIGLETPNMTGGTAKMLPNHHLTKPVLIGEIQEDGQFETVWQTEGEVAGDAWSDYLESSKVVVSDWTGEKTGDKPCGNYNTETKKCSGQNYE